MSSKNSVKILSVVFLIIILQISVDSNAQSKKETLPLSKMSGNIVAPLDEGKLILAVSDRILIQTLVKTNAKAGDLFYIFEQISALETDTMEPILKKIGSGVILEKIQDNLYLSVIDESTREISTGDMIFFADQL
jgi:hypothetical protein